MKTKEDIRPISYIKSHSAEMLAQVNDTQRPIYVTQNGEARAVLLDTESYEAMQRALAIMKLTSQSEKNIKEEKFQPQDELFSAIEKTLDQHDS